MDFSVSFVSSKMIPIKSLSKSLLMCKDFVVSVKVMDWYEKMFVLKINSVESVIDSFSTYGKLKCAPSVMVLGCCIYKEPTLIRIKSIIMEQQRINNLRKNIEINMLIFISFLYSNFTLISVDELSNHTLNVIQGYYYFKVRQ